MMGDNAKHRRYIQGDDDENYVSMPMMTPKVISITFPHFTGLTQNGAAKWPIAEILR